MLLLHGAGRVFGPHERRQSRVRAYSVRTVFAGRGDRGLRAHDSIAAGSASAVQRTAHAEPAERETRRGRQLAPRLREHVPALQFVPFFFIQREFHRRIEGVADVAAVPDARNAREFRGEQHVFGAEHI